MPITLRVPACVPRVSTDQSTLNLAWPAHPDGLCGEKKPWMLPRHLLFDLGFALHTLLESGDFFADHVKSLITRY
jgi:hypothetical protein